jgi:hypothetical protein
LSTSTTCQRRRLRPRAATRIPTSRSRSAAPTSTARLRRSPSPAFRQLSEGILYLADGTTPGRRRTPITAARRRLIFTPAANFNGTVTIPFTVTDNDGGTSAPANEVITVVDVNDLPTATASTSSGNEDTDIAVALGGTDIDGTIATVTVTSLPPASEGVLYLSDGTTPVVAGTPITAAQAAPTSSSRLPRTSTARSRSRSPSPTTTAAPARPPTRSSRSRR